MFCLYETYLKLKAHIFLSKRMKNYIQFTNHKKVAVNIEYHKSRLHNEEFDHS